jgi:hypothetical protein
VLAFSIHAVDKEPDSESEVEKNLALLHDPNASEFYTEKYLHLVLRSSASTLFLAGELPVICRAPSGERE